MVEPYKPIYTVKEVAKILRVNPNAVYDMMNAGKLTYLNLGSRKVRGRDLEQFINTFPCGMAGSDGNDKKEMVKG